MNPLVVRLTQEDPRHGTASYLGRSVGATTLTTTSTKCLDGPDASSGTATNGPTLRECPVVHVTVTSP